MDLYQNLLKPILILAMCQIYWVLFYSDLESCLHYITIIIIDFFWALMLLCMVCRFFILYVNPRVFIHLEMLSVRDVREELQFVSDLGFVLLLLTSVKI